MRSRLHHNDCISIWQRKHNFDTGAIKPGNGTNRIASGIKNIIGGVQLPYPRGLDQTATPAITHLEHSASHAPAAVECRKRNIELLKPPAEYPRQGNAERSKEPVPLSPCVELIFRCAFIEIPHLL